MPNSNLELFDLQKCLDGVHMQTPETMTEKYGNVAETQIIV